VPWEDERERGKNSEQTELGAPLENFSGPIYNKRGEGGEERSDRGRCRKGGTKNKALFGDGKNRNGSLGGKTVTQKGLQIIMGKGKRKVIKNCIASCSEKSAKKRTEKKKGKNGVGRETPSRGGA